MLTETAATSERLASAPLTTDAWAFYQQLEELSVVCRQSLLKESGLFSFVEMVPFCTCIAPFPVRGFGEFLHFLYSFSDYF